MEQRKRVSFSVPNSLQQQPQPPPRPSITINITNILLHDLKTQKRLGINIYYDDTETALQPYTVDNGDIVLFFLGRLFYRIDPVE